jgi:hypothetical protein
MFKQCSRRHLLFPMKKKTTIVNRTKNKGSYLTIFRGQNCNIEKDTGEKYLPTISWVNWRFILLIIKYRDCPWVFAVETKLERVKVRARSELQVELHLVNLELGT